MSLSPSSEPQFPVESKQESRGAINVASGGIGTLLAVLAQQLPDATWWKPVVLSAAPVVAVGISAVWQWIVRKVQRRSYEQAFKATALRMRTSLIATINDTTLPKSRRDVAKRELEELDRIEHDRIWQQIHVLNKKLQDD